MCVDMEVESKALEVPCGRADVEVWSSGALESCCRRADVEVWSSGALEGCRRRGIEVWSSEAREARSGRVACGGMGARELWSRAVGAQTWRYGALESCCRRADVEVLNGGDALQACRCRGDLSGGALPAFMCGGMEGVRRAAGV